MDSSVAPLWGNLAAPCPATADLDMVLISGDYPSFSHLFLQFYGAGFTLFFVFTRFSEELLPRCFKKMVLMVGEEIYFMLGGPWLVVYHPLLLIGVLPKTPLGDIRNCYSSPSIESLFSGLRGKSLYAVILFIISWNMDIIGYLVKRWCLIPSGRNYFLGPGSTADCLLTFVFLFLLCFFLCFLLAGWCLLLAYIFWIGWYVLLLIKEGNVCFFVAGYVSFGWRSCVCLKGSISVIRMHVQVIVFGFSVLFMRTMGDWVGLIIERGRTFMDFWYYICLPWDWELQVVGCMLQFRNRGLIVKCLTIYSSEISYAYPGFITSLLSLMLVMLCSINIS